MFGLYPPRNRFDEGPQVASIEPVNHYARPSLCLPPRIVPGVVLEGGRHDELQRESLCRPCIPPTVTSR